MKVFTVKIGKLRVSILVGLTVLLTCLLLLGLHQYGKPELKWEDGLTWQVVVYQRADHMMTPAPVWIVLNELEMSLQQRTGADQPYWCLQIKDLKGRQLFPGVYTLNLFYSYDLKIMAGTALKKDGHPQMNIHEFCTQSMYGLEFFDVNLNEHLTLGSFWYRSSNAIVLNQEKGRHSHWAKTQPWWSEYRSDYPPIQAQLLP